MKKIIFVRHGRAEEKSSEISDFERSLTADGKTISRIMAARFRKTESDPGLLVTSPAFRALETAFIFALQMNIPPEKVRIESDLYEKVDLIILLELVKKLDEQVNTVTLFGHNPAFTEIADRLSANGCDFMTKTSIVCLSFRITSWSGVKPAGGHIDYFLKPEKTE